MASGVGPLNGVCILAVEQYGAGPFATSQLAQLGARVIKIEQPETGGDVGRYVPPFNSGTDSLFFESFNQTKESIVLDISSAAGRQVFLDLVAKADVVFSNLRGDVPARLGLCYADLAPVNPKIVCVSLSAFGMTGPRSKAPGYDYIMQALAGWMSITGEPDGPPVKAGLSVVDFSAGLVAAIATLAALHQVGVTGEGTDCDLSLHDTSISLLTYLATWHLTTGWEPKRQSRAAHPSLVPFQLFRGSDDQWFMLGCAKEKFWERTAEIVGDPAITSDVRFSSFELRDEHHDELTRLLDAAFAAAPAAAWVQRLEQAGVPVALVQSFADALSDPQVEARGMKLVTEHPRLGRVVTVGTAVKVGEETVQPRRAPFLGEHTSQVLTDLAGYSRDAIDELVRSGVVRCERESTADG